MPGQPAEDVLAIIGVLNGYAWALDTRRFDDLRDVFTAGVEADYGSFTVKGVERMVDRMVRAHERVPRTQHHLGGYDVAIDGDIARSRCQVIATLCGSGSPRPIWRMGGWYADELVRTPDGWRVRRRRAHSIWSEGDTSVIAPARAAE